MPIKEPIKVEVLPEVESEVASLRLKGRFEKQKALFIANPWHRSLNFEKLEPRHLGIWSFRINDQYRALLVKSDKSTYQVFKVTDYH